MFYIKKNLKGRRKYQLPVAESIDFLALFKSPPVQSLKSL